MRTNSSKTHQQYKKYLAFKQQLLNAMITHDPLAILQSGIFQKYQQQTFPQHINPQKRLSKMQSLFKQYDIEGMNVSVIQKRSYSCSSYLNKESREREKIRRMEEQNKIDLMIWSNIMYNHFTIKPNTENNKESRENNMSMSNIFDSQSQNISKPEQLNNISKCKQLQKSILCTNGIFQAITSKLISNPSPKNIHFILKQLFTQFQQQNDKMISLLNQIRKQNGKLQRSVQDNSMKQLQYIVQIKALEKRIHQMEAQLTKVESKMRVKEEEMRDKQSNLNKTILLKMREMEYIQQQNTRKNYIQELKQKMAIDSIRRATLCSLNKQKFELQLKKEEMGLTFTSQQHFRNEEPSTGISASTQQTRCDEQ